MRVEAEPGATDDRELLLELLAAHQLSVIEGPAGKLVVVRDRSAPIRRRGALSGLLSNRADGQPVSFEF